MGRVSIIIPTYRPGLYFKECIDSIKSQVNRDPILEVIIVLNGERRGYFEDILKWIGNCDIFKLIFSSSVGVSNARNLGIELAHGDYLLFLDDDDYISSDFLQGLINRIEVGDPPESSIVVSRFLTFDDQSNKIGEDYVTMAYNNLKHASTFNIVKYRGFLSSVCGKLIPRKVVANFRFKPYVKISEDGLFMFEISQNITSIILAEENVIYYRRLRSGSALRSKKTWVYRTRLWIASLKNYSMVYFSAPLKYSFIFFVTRLLAVSKVYFYSFFK
ncbi:glycosyltransferase family 2 protein [Sphingobacterium detergens]|uniref:GT2 family glycosyltransferase n=1 Tax=Sphingobacterium detergens TaxID=1145106 RepID=A0A420ALR8_SPHD1|nr:glycosyltransferase family 2 protein [Sphingobacterium detergens]RKE45388.1 GT2 family glycosyltransferase [Sphingobacterium detergens]